MYDAYTRIFERCGLTLQGRRGRHRAIGGTLLPRVHGARRHRRGRRRDLRGLRLRGEPREGRGRRARPRAAPRRSGPRTRVVDARRCAPSRRSRRSSASAPDRLVKTLHLRRGRRARRRPGARRPRGQRDQAQEPPRRARGCALADAGQVAQVTGAPVGFAGPVGLDGVPVFADRHVAALANFVAGANEADAHLVDVCHGRDFAVAAWADLTSAERRRPLPAVRQAAARSCAASRSATSSSSARSTREAMQRDLPRRGGEGAGQRHGLLRHRRRPHRRRRRSSRTTTRTASSGRCRSRRSRCTS